MWCTGPVIAGRLLDMSVSVEESDRRRSLEALCASTLMPCTPTRGAGQMR
jgi:hypothetical protein